MKKILFSVALIVSSTTLIHAQEGKSNAFKVNILSPIVKSGSFFYERAINETSSAQLGVGFTAYKADFLKISGVFFTPEYRFYLSNEVMNGFYIAPFARYQNLKIEDTESDPTSPDKATLSTIGGGLTVGRQWLFKDIVTLDIFLGPSYNSGKMKVTSGDEVEDVPGVFNGFGLRTGVTLGIAF
ncbi:MAG TPA: DUF3575 domain-containing protein [Flavisolibacter sp.]|jgi:hypothetical protein|nr:DUF3575 domain-containing protein [Flavisolibacter sp.]